MDHFIQIAEIKVAGGPDVLKTVVGSCIALCFWDKEKRMGGMAHIFMPVHRDHDTSKGRYADTAVEALLDAMLKKGSRVKNLVASIVGGASMFNKGNAGPMKTIGLQNFEVVRDQLRELQIPVRVEEVGGAMGRRVQLECKSGNVAVSTVGAWNA